MTWKTALAGAGLLLSASSAAAESYPSKPVTLIIPMAPGGSSDIMGRSIAQKLSEMWGQPVVVENKAGATTTVGTAQVARAAPDGYTLLLAPPPFIITQHVYPNLSYSTEKSFDPVSLVSYYPLVMVVNASLPIHNMKDLVEYARKNPGLAYPSPGAGTTPHLIGEMLARREKLDLVHVPYKSGGQGVIDLVAGRLQFYAGVPTEVMPNIKAGKLRAIAVLAEGRSEQLPDVQTSEQAGYGYLQAQSWTSIASPKGTPKTVVDKISADIAKIVQQADVREKLIPQGVVFVGSSPAELGKFYKDEDARFGPLVKTIGLKPDQ
ncbi:tripartite tricarboxylate transporter substrate binding protein [Bosea sp. (in: a-proteobacteria)]|jgi:tripartite-type tricarboxylate transporter receptor subunit TctC|uniref:Bug family tripartite tricarboxylate transporter substrate binding protein n=1 Tax=Bosea sp. (in: a-proteobacteria) TaxID=1871050 RepID=UPI002DDDA8E1|nr:tripartite tricarboxylate transporter substrate binding protein [Bosea sp. (in: a-proteobacteria)]HEV2508443.1 tripartite tricarboxylate transporter substrate binding protein [Bosea sp. (in: a-proteobacteria)]